MTTQTTVGMQAHRQWATRPDDQRFLSLTELKDSVSARRTISRERDFPLRKLNAVHTAEGALAMSGHNGNIVNLTNWSMGQLCIQAKAPASYLRTLPAPIAALNLNTRFQLQGMAGDSDAKLLYVPPQNETPGELRAVTSTRYGRIWDSQVVDQVIRMNQDERWSVPLEAYGGVNSKLATTLYASDRDVWMFLVDKSAELEIGGTSLRRGIIVWNSEVGSATLGLMTFTYDRVCQNRMIWGMGNVSEMRIRHNALAPDRFARDVQPALRAYADGSTTALEDAVKQAKRKVLPTVQDAEKFLAAAGFTESAIKTGVLLANDPAAGSDGGNPLSYWNLASGLTAYARQITHQDQRVAFEKSVGDKVLNRALGA